MDVFDFANGFQLNNQSVFDQEVDSVSAIQVNAFVFYR